MADSNRLMLWRYRRLSIKQSAVFQYDLKHRAVFNFWFVRAAEARNGHLWQMEGMHHPQLPKAYMEDFPMVMAVVKKAGSWVWCLLNTPASIDRYQ